MQIKIFTVPLQGGEVASEELNRFLRGHKILQVEQQLVSEASGSSWTFCVRYINGSSVEPRGSREKKDYKTELSAEAFVRFTDLRKVRKKMAEEDGVPAFAIFTDAQMSALAQLEELTVTSMQTVSGIGEKKAEKYSERMLVHLEQAKT